MRHTEAAVVGAGQAGLATSYWLAERGIDQVLLERDRPGTSWLDRWDSFCLVTPNWTLDLPGFPYDGDDPDGFLLRDAIADYVKRYRDFLNAPVQESTEVRQLSRTGSGWTLQTSRGPWSARSVVVATGAFPFPSIPPCGRDIGSGLLQLHSQSYRRPSDLPDGGVLVVGSGQSGAQIVDDLMIAGRQVWFSIGRSGHVPRRYRGRDTTVWLSEIGFMDMVVTEEMRQRPSMMVSGRDGGKDLNLRAFGREGVHLVGRVVGADGSKLVLAGNVADILDGADAVAMQVKGQVDRFISEHDIDAPTPEIEAIDWVPEASPPRLDLRAEGITTVIWATGYRHDYSWIDAAVFDERGYPRQHRGVTAEPGLYFIGLHGMHTTGSGLFSGVGGDARYVVEHLAGTLS
ncbi:MAG: NAD(P)-binding domain-containing protein [Acidimicrobiia bacterium]|nr:NAD(P)-binding domain-containing protein [Acidimicrobiia bacterium]